MNRCRHCGVRISEDRAACDRHRHLAHEEQDLWDSDLFDSELSWSSQHSLLQLSDRFQQPEPIGNGGSSTVYRVHGRLEKRPLALKYYHLSEQQGKLGFQREVETLRRLASDFVPRLYAWSDEEDGRYIAMELIDAPTLAQILADAQGQLCSEQGFKIFKDLLKVVEALHERGFVHRDLKPENIFWSAESGAILVDFERSLAISGQGVCGPEDRGAGTAEYMAPEQCLGEVKADPRLDVYSLGVILYELISGSPPFWGADAEVRRRLCNQRPTPLINLVDELVPGLHQVVHRCLQKDPAQRFASLRELIHAFERAQSPNANLQARKRGSTSESFLYHPVPKRNEEEKSASVLLGVLWISCSLSRGRWLPMLAEVGAKLMWSRASRHIAVIPAQSYQDAVDRASAIAHRLAARNPSLKVVVDIAWATPYKSASGSLYYDSPLWLSEDRFLEYDSSASVRWTPVASLWVCKSAKAPAGDDTFTTVSEGVNSLDPGENCRAEELLPDTEDWMNRLRQGRHLWWTVTGQEGQGKSHLCRTLAQRWLGQCGGLLRLRARLPQDAMWSCALAHGPQQSSSPSLRNDAKLAEWMQLVHSENCLELWQDLLSYYQGQGPLLLLIDDAHCLPWKWLYALEHCLERVSSNGVAVVLFAESLWGLARSGLGRRVAPTRHTDLDYLDQEQGRALLRARLEPLEGFDAGVLDVVAQYCGHDPRVVVEIVESSLRSGIIKPTRDGRGWCWDLPCFDNRRGGELPEPGPEPEGSAWDIIIKSTLASLSDGLWEMANVAAYLDEPFRFSAFRQLTAQLDLEGISLGSGMDPAVALNRLVSARILRYEGESHYAFRFPKLREELLRRREQTAVNRSSTEGRFRGTGLKNEEGIRFKGR